MSSLRYDTPVAITMARAGTSVPSVSCTIRRSPSTRGSIAATNYSASVQNELTRHPGITDHVRQLLTDNVGSAIHTSGQLGVNGAEIASIARTAFVNSMSVSLWVAVGLAVTATVIAVVQLPRRERRVDATPAHGTVDHVETITLSVLDSAR